MKSHGPKLGIAVGLVTTPFLIVPLMQLFLGHCIFEQGCGKYEGLMLFGVFLAACALGVGIAFIVGWLANFIVQHWR